MRRGASALALAGLAACSGGHSSPILPIAAGASGVSSTQKLFPATLSIEVPSAALAASATKRGPDYVSSGTTTIGAMLLSPPPGYVQPSPITVMPGTAPCPPDPLHPGNFLCSLTIALPPGTDAVQITASGAGSVLSSQIASLAVLAGVANVFPVTLDGKAATLLVGSPGMAGACQAPLAPGPSVASLFAPYGQPTVVSLTALDGAGKKIAGLGAPAIAVDNSFVNGSLTTGGGPIAYTIDQAGQTVTFTPATGAQSVSVTIQEIEANPAAGANPGDGLNFSSSGTFTLVPGAPLPANLLAVGFGGLPGSIGFETVTLGGANGPDTFAAPLTLARTTSVDGASLPDVDSPLALKFDAGNDLLIANGGNGTPADTGNLACVPAGALFGTTPSATAVKFDIDVPTGLAYDSRDGSVGVDNGAPGALLQLAEYTLQPTYALTPLANRAISKPGVGATSVVSLPSLVAGSYAETLTNGIASNAPAQNGASFVEVQPAGGVPYMIADTGTIDVPRSVGWDAQSGQLVVGSYGTATTQYLAFYQGAGPAPARVTRLNTGLTNDVLAISPDGHVAIAGEYSPEPQVKIYGPAAGGRSNVFGPIPFNGIGVTGNYLYDVGTTGGTASVTAMTWLSNTKLLVALSTGLAAKQGLYVFDISTTTTLANCFDDLTGIPCFPSATQTGFLQTPTAPTALTFKP